MDLAEGDGRKAPVSSWNAAAGMSPLLLMPIASSWLVWPAALDQAGPAIVHRYAGWRLRANAQTGAVRGRTIELSIPFEDSP